MPAILKDEIRPLEERLIQVIGAGGGKMSRSALDISWVETVDFLGFPALPGEWDEATISEWEQRLSFIEEDLQWLLKLPHHKFWSQCLVDHEKFGHNDHQVEWHRGIHEAAVKGHLVCGKPKLRPRPFLSRLPVKIRGKIRYYDREHHFPPSLSDRHKSVHRLVFMAFLRLSTHKESKDNFISPGAFGDIIYNNYIFDAVKLLELSVLYGGGNAGLLSKMVENVIKQQPNYLSDMKMVIPTILEAFNTIMMKCGYKENTANTGPTELTENRQYSDLMTQSIAEVRDIIFYILDSALSLGAFLDIYPQASHIFFDQGFVLKVSSFCEFVLPALANTIQERDIPDDRLREDMWQQLVSAKVGFAKACHSIINVCCIQPVLESSGHDDKVVVHVERYLDTLSSLLSDKMFVAVVAEQGNIQEDLELVLQSSPQIDEARTQFLLEGINTALEMYSKKVQPLQPTAAAQSSGDSAEAYCQEDLQTDAQMVDHVAVMGASAPRKTGVELESLITEVKDLLPDLSEGFVEICLEEYNYDTAKLINGILENKLLPSLQELDRNMPRDNPPEPSPSETNTEPIPGSLLAVRDNVYDGDEFDVFAGKNVDTSKVHKGKKSDRESQSALEDKSELRGLRSTYEDYYFEFDDEYEDEYDDTYDTQNVGAQDKDSVDELTSIRPFTQPRVLQRREDTGSDEDESSEAEDAEGAQNRERPLVRDQFVPRPPSEYNRGRGRGAGRSRGGGRGGGGGGGRGGGGGGGRGGGPRNESNKRQGNERHKSSRANHNRKAGASHKRGRGMVPS